MFFYRDLEEAEKEAAEKAITEEAQVNAEGDAPTSFNGFQRDSLYIKKLIAYNNFIGQTHNGSTFSYYFIILSRIV